MDLRHIFILLVILPVLFAACRKENALDCFKANGPDITETRNPGQFRDVEVFDKMELHVRQGSEYKVEIFGGRHIMGNIRTEVKDGKLSIDNRNTCNFVRGYKRGVKVVVTMPYLRFLQNNGVGTSYVDDFVQDTIVVRAESSGDIHVSGHFGEVRTSAHGNGDMYVRGTCNSFQVYTYGTNFVHAEELSTASFAFVHSQTLGDCTVKADSLMLFACNLENDGNVYYIGEPRLIIDYSTNEKRGRLYKK